MRGDNSPGQKFIEWINTEIVVYLISCECIDNYIAGDKAVIMATLHASASSMQALAFKRSFPGLLSSGTKFDRNNCSSKPRISCNL